MYETWCLKTMGSGPKMVIVAGFHESLGPNQDPLGPTVISVLG